MLEADVHNHLKHLLSGSKSVWPHNLTFSRFVARTLRRRDNSLIHLRVDPEDTWWPGLLIPLCLEPGNAVLVLSNSLRRSFFQVELPRLKTKGFVLPCWEGSSPPMHGELWILSHDALISSFYKGFLNAKHLIVPEVESLSEKLGQSMELVINTDIWNKWISDYPSAKTCLMKLYERMTRKLFAQAIGRDAIVRMDSTEIIELKEIIGNLLPTVTFWHNLLSSDSHLWASWAELDHNNLGWTWHLKPLEPLRVIKGLLSTQPVLLITTSPQTSLFISDLKSASCLCNVQVSLGTPILQESIQLFAPSFQPLPNNQCYANHVVDQCRRLIIGQNGLTIILLDDQSFRRSLASKLAAEFGRRVVHEMTVFQVNGVVCCSWSWWMNHQHELPVPTQLIVGLLPLASVESPFVAAKVEAFKREGKDWFRELLLPEALNLFTHAVASIRSNGGRLAILDGRLRSRSWGAKFLQALEPWELLQRLLPP